MKEITCLEKNVSIFHTPYCDISVTDENGEYILFDVMDSPEDSPTVYIDNDMNKEIPVIYGMGKTLRIYTKNLLPERLEIKRQWKNRQELCVHLTKKQVHHS